VEVEDDMADIEARPQEHHSKAQHGEEQRAEELRQRYAEERSKRLRADGDAQYHELKGVYRDFDADPWVEPGFTRDPVVEETDVLIVGAGWGGMTTAAFLRKEGVHDFRIIEKAGDFGGTWYWNRYPGCMCDVESYCYIPLLEESGWMPKHKYSHASEIFEYCQHLARRYDMSRRRCSRPRSPTWSGTGWRTGGS
jgi:hypothetical protein